MAGLVHQLEPVIGPISEEVLHPRPALADAVEDCLRAGAVGDVGRGKVHHEQPTIGVDSDMPLASNDLLGSIEAALAS